MRKTTQNLSGQPVRLTPAITGFVCDWMIGVRIPAGAGNYSLRHHVQTGSGAHLASYPMGTGGSSPEDKAAGA
jgi:hypothetical protein